MDRNESEKFEMVARCSECGTAWSPPKGEIVACQSCGNTQNIIYDGRYNLLARICKGLQLKSKTN